MNEPQRVTRKASDLRQAFDQSFATVSSRESHEVEDILLIRVAGDAYAIRLREISSIVAKRDVVPLPTIGSHLIGLAGIRGTVVPVFALASLFGYAQAPDASRWMVLCATEEPIALAFSEFEGYLRLPASSFSTDESLRNERDDSTEIARTDTGARRVLNISRIVTTIRKRNSRDRLPRE